MERNNQKKKRSRAVDGDGDGDRKKERERKGKGKDVVEIEPAVVVAEDEVEEFFAILQRMQDAVKLYDKGKAVAAAGVKLPEIDDGDGVKKKITNGDVVLLDLNCVPHDDGE